MFEDLLSNREERSGGVPTVALPIAGAWRADFPTEEVRSPYDNRLVAHLPVADEAAMDAAIAAAVEVFAELRSWPRYRRRDVLLAIAAGLTAKREALACLMTAESGKPIAFSRIEVDRAVTTFGLAAEEATRFGGEVLPLDLSAATADYTALVTRFPMGPIGAIAPFNFPLNLVAHKLGPAIAVGNPVVLKPAPQSPLSALALAEICFAAGLPMAALSVVHCAIPTAEKLATDPRLKLLSFTGSATVGWHLKAVAGEKRVVLELGGNAAALVCADADLDWAAERIALGAFAQSGQVCIKVQRVLVEAAIYDAFQAKLIERTASLKVGDPSDPAVVCGPMIDQANADRVVSWIEEAVAAGAKLLMGGERDGAVIRPTWLTHTTASMKVEADEVFGPVATLAPVASFEAGIEQINASAYGLQAGVFTHDLRRIWRAYETLDVGGVIINDYPTLRVDNYPYGGIKASGLGREGVRYAMEEMSELKTLVLNVRK